MERIGRLLVSGIGNGFARQDSNKAIAVERVRMKGEGFRVNVAFSDTRAGGVCAQLGITTPDPGIRREEEESASSEMIDIGAMSQRLDVV